MSNLIDIDPPNNGEQDEIDAFNDETFGCDPADINDDWEEAHDKLLPSFFPTNEGKNIENFDDLKISQKGTFSAENIENFLNSQHSTKRLTSVNDVFPQCEDIVKQSISDFILDEDQYDNNDDIYPDFASYELEMQSDPVAPKSNSKIDAKNINLGSLRPPSPSILPFDDPFMSSVWRPLSPELLTNQNSTDNSQQQIFSRSPNDSKILTLEELEKNLTLNGHDSISAKSSSIPKAKVIRLEDLEAQLMVDKPKREPTPPSTASNSFSSAPSVMTNSNVNSQQQLPAYMLGKMPPNIMEMAAMSLAKLSLPHQSIIPQANKILPPPPGLGSNFNLSGTSSVESQSSIQTQNHQAYMSKLAAQKGSDAFQSQMAMANAMVNALANMSHLPSVRPPMGHMPMMAPELKLTPSSSPLVLDPMVQQEQQRIISKIITPAQAQRFYPSQMSNFLSQRNHDKFAGFMTQKEKDWLVKIFRLQCKVNDPYVEDYYEVTFKVRKATLERRQILAKQHNKNVDDVEIDSIIESEPMIVLPELAKVEEDKPKYIQFDNALGKIQVLNTKCPRKLLDVNPEKHSLLKLDKFSTNLMKIERLYEYLLNIEDEDKRMPILPENAIQFHRDKRVQFCKNLFQGLVKTIDGSSKDDATYFALIQRNMPTLKKIDIQVDPELLSINKGLHLVYRSLVQLRDENQLVVLICSLLKGSNYQKFFLQAERDAHTNFGSILIKSIGRIEQTRNLIYIASALENFDLITHHKYGHLLLLTIFKQYQVSNDKLLFVYFWKLFVQTLFEHLSSYPEMQQLCKDHYQYLAQL